MYGLGYRENLNVKKQTFKLLCKLMEEYLNALKMGYREIHKSDKQYNMQRIWLLNCTI